MVGSKTICSLLMLMVFTFTSAKTLRDSSVKDSKSNVGVVGGITKKDPTEHKYYLMAEDSLRQYEAQNNLELDNVVLRVTEASEQVVAGLLTRLHFLAIPAVCKQESHQRTANCQKTLRDSSVKTSQSDVPLPGGVVVMDPTEHKYYLMAEDSLRQYEAQNNLELDNVVLRVTKATEQVVSGLSTRLEFLAVPAVCKQESHQRTANCQVDYIQNVLLCHSELWDQPWLHRRQITVTCDNLLTGAS
ncbi:unnamed protein product [Danaus chrysippus]|uniref:(African queen) hypothetical protein n=1 Tax=Danaus chrysippus TaxID=151541 RepID=A0A8J2QNB1_9NEOP|nr:unnamed protein product [Danaus chrysippus]